MDKIKCPYCSKEFKVLWPHLKYKHNVSNMEQFKKDFPDIGLVSDQIRTIHYTNALSRGFGKDRAGIKLSEEHKAKLGRSGEENPFYGKKHTDETKRKMKANHADFTGDKNPLTKWVNKDVKNKRWYSDHMRGKWEKFKEDPEKYVAFCQNQSKNSSRLIVEGVLTSSNHKNGQYFSKRQNKHIIYRSAYEHKYLMLCEVDNAIAEFDACHFSIPYMYDNKQKLYIPDFKIIYVNNTCSIVEIKPSWRITEEQNQIKFKAAESFSSALGYSFEVITEQELFGSLKEAVDYSKSLTYEKSKIIYDEVGF